MPKTWILNRIQLCQNGPKNTDNSQLTATILWKTLRLLLLVAVGPSVSAFGLLDSGLFNIFKVKFVFQVFQDLIVVTLLFVFSGLNFVIQSLGFCYRVSPMFHIPCFVKHPLYVLSVFWWFLSVSPVCLHVCFPPIPLSSSCVLVWVSLCTSFFILIVSRPLCALLSFASCLWVISSSGVSTCCPSSCYPVCIYCVHLCPHSPSACGHVVLYCSVFLGLLKVLVFPV